jgi:hypothetical protein
MLTVCALALSAAWPMAASADKPAPGNSSTPTVCDEWPFLAENSAAMDKMMAGMDIKPTGDVDGDFAAMMIAHHQGAIDMAIAELRYGRNEQLRRISQEIIVDQQQEIAAMRTALGQPLPTSAPAPTQVPAREPTHTPAQAGCGARTNPMSMSPSMHAQ